MGNYFFFMIKVEFCGSLEGVENIFFCEEDFYTFKMSSFEKSYSIILKDLKESSKGVVLLDRKFFVVELN